MILFDKYKGSHMGKRFTFTIDYQIKNFSNKGMKTFSAQNKGRLTLQKNSN